MSQTPTAVLKSWLLRVLLDAPNHRLTTLGALERMDDLWGEGLTEDDRSFHPSKKEHGTEPKWSINTRFARDRFVKDGVLARPDVAGRGVWQLTDVGLDVAVRLAAPPVVASEESEVLAELVDDNFRQVKVRPEQIRFAREVFSRYGRVCAVCHLDVPSVIQAAHVRSKLDRGADTSANGLPLCGNHHLALDAGLWTVEPRTLRVLIQVGGPSARDLQITVRDLHHLPALPRHEDVLFRWELSTARATYT